VILIDEDTKTSYNLQSNHRLEFATQRLTEKHFKLVAGAQSFVESESPQVELQPKDYVLMQNFPNPFNPATQIIYALPQPARVALQVFNVEGKLVATLVNERQEKGSHTVVWSAAGVGSGVYFIRLEAGKFSSVRKCVLAK